MENIVILFSDNTELSSKTKNNFEIVALKVAYKMPFYIYLIFKRKILRKVYHHRPVYYKITYFILIMLCVPLITQPSILSDYDMLILKSYLQTELIGC